MGVPPGAEGKDRMFYRGALQLCPRQPCYHHHSLGKRPRQPHPRTGPAGGSQALGLTTGGLWCWRPRLGRLSVPGQLFA